MKKWVFFILCLCALIALSLFTFLKLGDSVSERDAEIIGDINTAHKEED